jgi:hypothetical protein
MGRKLTHDEFIKRVTDCNIGFANGNYSIIGKYINKRTHLQCLCNIHNRLWSALPEQLYGGITCPQCNDSRYTSNNHRQKTFGNRPNLWETHPEIAKLLKDPNNGYLYTHGTAKRMEFVCPDCGNVRFLSLNSVVHYGFACLKCSDGVSLPNKYSRALLDQLMHNDYVCEYRPDWAKPYFYDNYFELNNQRYILEMDGAYHYCEKTVSPKTLEERQNDDRIKDELAKKNDVRVIRINCSIATTDVIKEQILKSELTNIFDLSKIDWELCDKKSQKNLVKQSCELYMSRLYTNTEIRSLLHISRDTLLRYLKAGAKIGWCDYDVEKHKTNPKKIFVLNDSGDIVHCFYGLRECARQIKDIYNIDVYRHYIVRACNTNKPYKGFWFKLEYNSQYKMIDTNEEVQICDTLYK